MGDYCGCRRRREKKMRRGDMILWCRPSRNVFPKTEAPCWGILLSLVPRSYSTRTRRFSGRVHEWLFSLHIWNVIVTLNEIHDVCRCSMIPAFHSAKKTSGPALVYKIASEKCASVQFQLVVYAIRKAGLSNRSMNLSAIRHQHIDQQITMLWHSVALESDRCSNGICSKTPRQSRHALVALQRRRQTHFILVLKSSPKDKVCLPMQSQLEFCLHKTFLEPQSMLQ